MVQHGVGSTVAMARVFDSFFVYASGLLPVQIHQFLVRSDFYQRRTCPKQASEQDMICISRTSA